MNTQTPNEQLELFLSRYTDEIAGAARQALRHLRRRVPGATELVYDNYNALAIGFGPSETPSQVVFSITAYPRWVTLFFLQGAGLPDPQNLLQGSGVRVRHIVLTTAQVIGSPAVDALIGHALRAAKVAIDPKAKRALVIKSISPRQRPRRPPAKAQKASQRGVDYETVRELAMALPGVVDSSTLRGIQFKTRGKLLACKAINRSAEPGSLMVRVGAAEQDRLIAALPDACYVTPHYRLYESILVRLARIDRKSLQDVLAVAWKFVTAAPASRKKPTKRKKAASVFRFL
ncbi:MAG TPA: hypothetical protein VK696_10810 [Steroidobacteraceae bacterium]|jgi:hypothetical protein|nr:hypothetical protein [Steroidobacteraceae bacterium]